jgi:hypothetical protein
MRKLRQLIRFVRVAMAARRVQDYLWNAPGERSYESELLRWNSWLAQIRKRVTKLDAVNRSTYHWRVEARKRLLQIAALAVAMMEAIDKGALDE